MTRHDLIGVTTGTILLSAMLTCIAMFSPAKQQVSLAEADAIIHSNPLRRGDRESLAAIDGAIAMLRQGTEQSKVEDVAPPAPAMAPVPVPVTANDLSYLADYAYSEVPPDKKPADVVRDSLQNIPLGTPVEEIKLASDAFGMDFTFMKAVARIESDFDPKQRTGSYIGLFQLSKYEFGMYGSGDIVSPRDNAIAAAYKFAVASALFEIDTHIKPTLFTLYLIHQQGWQGAAEHVSHPERIAWQSMCATDEGHEKGEKWCKRAIWQNTLPDIKKAYKSVENLSSGAFTDMWRQRLAMFYARYSETISAK